MMKHPRQIALLDAQNESLPLKNQIEKLENQCLTLQGKIASLKDKLARVTFQPLDAQNIFPWVVGLMYMKTLPVTPIHFGYIDDNPQFWDLHRMRDFFGQWDYIVSFSRIFQHCDWAVCSLFNKHPAVYKIGITEHVIIRWISKSYTYKCDPHDDWQQMDVLFVGKDSLYNVYSRFL